MRVKRKLKENLQARKILVLGDHEKKSVAIAFYK